MREQYKPPEITVEAVVDGRVIYQLVCQSCGGFEQVLKGDGSPMSMVHCAACKTWLGRLAALNVHAAMIALAAGHPIDRRDYLPGGRFAVGVPAR